MFTKTKKLFTAVLLGFVTLSAVGQDFPQYTQYVNMQGLINPGYTGSRDYYSGLMDYRYQWVGFDASPRTLGFNFHGPVPVENLSAGIVVMAEKIGLNSNVDVALASAYAVQLNDDIRLSFGLQAGFSSLAFDMGSINISDPSDPVYQRSLDNYFRPNFGFGTFLHTEKYFAGFSMPRMLTHSTERETESIKTSFSFKTMHMFLYGGYVFDVDEDFKVKPTLLMKSIYGSPIEFDLGAHAFYRDYGSLGLIFRTGSDIILATEFRVWEQLYVGYSFDYPLTKLNRVTWGSHEISLRIDLDASIFSGSGPVSRGMRSIRYF